MKKKKRAIAYTRVSTAEQTEKGFSLSDQSEAIKKWVEASGWELVGEYSDPGISGKTIEDRPGLRSVLSAATRGEFDVVVCKDLDRLGRSLLDLLNIIKSLDENGIKVAFVEQKIDTTSDVGEFFLQILGGLAEFERKTMAKRTKAGKRKAYEKGLHAFGGSSRPYGFVFNKEDKVLEPVADEIRAVKRIMKLALRGESFRKIAQMMNEEGYPTKFAEKRTPTTQSKQKIKWSYNTVKRIIFNTIYSRPTKLAGMKEPVAIKANKYPIPLSVQDRAMAIATKRKRQTPMKRRAKRILAGYLYCYECGRRLYARYTHQKGKDYWYYGCSGVEEQPRTCTSRLIPGPELEKALWESFVVDIVGNPGVYIENSQPEGGKEELEDLRKEKESLQAKIETKEKELKTLYKQVAQGTRSHRILRETQEEFEKNIQWLERQLRSIEIEIGNREYREGQWEKLKKDAYMVHVLSRRIGRKLLKLSGEEQRELIEASWGRVSVDWKGYVKDSKIEYQSFYHYHDLEWDIEIGLKWLQAKFRFGDQLKEVKAQVKEEGEDWGKMLEDMGIAVAQR